jgi:hypothetical protein
MSLSTQLELSPMNAQPKSIRTYPHTKIVAVPLRAAGAGLQLLLKTGLLPEAIRSLRFVCDLDDAGQPRVKVIVAAECNTQPVTPDVPVELRGPLEESFSRFLTRSRLGPSAVKRTVDVWEWSAHLDLLTRRRHRSVAKSYKPAG